MSKFEWLEILVSLVVVGMVYGVFSFFHIRTNGMIGFFGLIPLFIMGIIKEAKERRSE